ncbi:MAG: Hsp20/alpha crystallin family protein [Gemmatimonadaceae bacterium]
MLYRMTTGSPIFGLRREIDRLFEDTFARDGSSFTPAVDIKENDNEIRLELELAGLKPEDVEISAENGVLSIRGEKHAERKEGDETRYQVVERTYGTFMRTFQLPQGVDEDQIKAEFENGVLTIHIPKAALPQPKRIQIAAGTQPRQEAQVGSGNMTNQPSSSQQLADRTNQKSSTPVKKDREKEGMAAQSH